MKFPVFFQLAGNLASGGTGSNVSIPFFTSVEVARFVRVRSEGLTAAGTPGDPAEHDNRGAT